MNESGEQKAFVAWLRAQKIRCFSIPNSMFRERTPKAFGMIAKMKAEGMTSGIPDLCVLAHCADGKKRLFWVEMKAPEMKPKKGGKGGVSDEQREWIDAFCEVEETGVAVCYGVDCAVADYEEFCRSFAPQK
jgi:hypothetical protein